MLGHSINGLPIRCRRLWIAAIAVALVGGFREGIVGVADAFGAEVVLPQPGIGPKMAGTAAAPFEVKGKVKRIVVTASEEPPAEAEAGGGAGAGSPMLDRLAGILAELPANDLAKLKALIPKGSTHVGPPPGARRWCVVHVATDKETRRFAIERTPEGSIYAAVIDDSLDHPPRLELDRLKSAEFMLGWSAFRGEFEPAATATPGAEPEIKQGEVPEAEPAVPPSTSTPTPTGPRRQSPMALAKRPVPGVVALEAPIEFGWFTFDKALMTSRISGAPWGHEGMSRDLEHESFTMRVPTGYTPREPVGLLVWIDPGNQGGPPQFTHAALDALRIIGVGANFAGNARAIPDRFQLAFDAIATVSARYHIDPRRVYVSGVSGGGRSSSILTACFPDVFTGAVPIVGMSWCDRVPDGVGKFFPAGFARPNGALFGLWRQRPVAPITGPRDFNYREITSAAELMRRAGLQVKVFSVPEMGHHAPKPEVFREALEWVDQPYQQARDRETQAAQKALERAESAKTDEAKRKLLIQATKEGPWTKPAWRAVELLRAMGG